MDNKNPYDDRGEDVACKIAYDLASLVADRGADLVNAFESVFKEIGKQGLTPKILEATVQGFLYKLKK